MNSLVFVLFPFTNLVCTKGWVLSRAGFVKARSPPFQFCCQLCIMNANCKKHFCCPLILKSRWRDGLIIWVCLVQDSKVSHKTHKRFQLWELMIACSVQSVSPVQGNYKTNREESCHHSPSGIEHCTGRRHAVNAVK